MWQAGHRVSFIGFGFRSFSIGRALVVAALVVAVAACAPTPSVETKRTVALHELPEITLTIVNTHDGAVRLSGPLGNAFDVLEGEALSLRLVVAALADFDESMFRPWLVPVGPVVRRLVELDAPGLIRLDGLSGQITLVLPNGDVGTILVTVRDCPGDGWLSRRAQAKEFTVASAEAPAAPIRLCPDSGA